MMNNSFSKNFYISQERFTSPLIGISHTTYNNKNIYNKVNNFDTYVKEKGNNLNNNHNKFSLSESLLEEDASIHQDTNNSSMLGNNNNKNPHSNYFATHDYSNNDCSNNKKTLSCNITEDSCFNNNNKESNSVNDNISKQKSSFTYIDNIFNNVKNEKSNVKDKNKKSNIEITNNEIPTLKSFRNNVNNVTFNSSLISNIDYNNFNNENKVVVYNTNVNYNFLSKKRPAIRKNKNQIEFNTIKTSNKDDNNNNNCISTQINSNINKKAFEENSNKKNNSNNENNKLENEKFQVSKPLPLMINLKKNNELKDSKESFKTKITSNNNNRNHNKNCELNQIKNKITQIIRREKEKNKANNKAKSYLDEMPAELNNQSFLLNINTINKLKNKKIKKMLHNKRYYFKKKLLRIKRTETVESLNNVITDNKVLIKFLEIDLKELGINICMDDACEYNTLDTHDHDTLDMSLNIEKSMKIDDIEENNKEKHDNNDNKEDLINNVIYNKVYSPNEIVLVIEKCLEHSIINHKEINLLVDLFLKHLNYKAAGINKKFLIVDKKIKKIEEEIEEVVFIAKKILLMSESSNETNSIQEKALSFGISSHRMEINKNVFNLIENIIHDVNDKPNNRLKHNEVIYELINKAKEKLELLYFNLIEEAQVTCLKSKSIDKKDNITAETAKIKEITSKQSNKNITYEIKENTPINNVISIQENINDENKNYNKKENNDKKISVDTNKNNNKNTSKSIILDTSKDSHQNNSKDISKDISKNNNKDTSNISDNSNHNKHIFTTKSIINSKSNKIDKSCSNKIDSKNMKNKQLTKRKRNIALKKQRNSTDTIDKDKNIILINKHLTSQYIEDQLKNNFSKAMEITTNSSKLINKNLFTKFSNFLNKCKDESDITNNSIKISNINENKIKSTTKCLFAIVKSDFSNTKKEKYRFQTNFTTKPDKIDAEKGDIKVGTNNNKDRECTINNATLQTPSKINVDFTNQEKTLLNDNNELLFESTKAKTIKSEGYSCYLCNKTYKSGFALGGHMSRSHPHSSDRYKVKLETRTKRSKQRAVNTLAKIEFCKLFSLNYENIIKTKIGKKQLKYFFKKNSRDYNKVLRDFKAKAIDIKLLSKSSLHKVVESNSNRVIESNGNAKTDKIKEVNEYNSVDDELKSLSCSSISKDSLGNITFSYNSKNKEVFI